MKKRNIYLIVLILIILIVSRIVRHIYYYNLNDNNNVIITLCPEFPFNSKDNDTVKYVNIKIYMDGNEIYSTDSLDISYTIIKRNETLGKHSLKVVTDSVHVNEITFYLFPLKWFLIEYNDRNNTLPTSITESESPLKLM